MGRVARKTKRRFENLIAWAFAVLLFALVGTGLYAIYVVVVAP